MTSGHRTNPSRLRRFLRAPLLHFILIGTAAYGVNAWITNDDPSLFVHITRGDLRNLESGWEEQMGRLPGPGERASLLRSEINDRLLLEEAFSRGWHRTDGIAQRRLIQNQRFLHPEDEASDAEMLERAYAQGMDRSDLVVKRRLLERMRGVASASARATPAQRSELESYLTDHASQFVRPEQIRLSHVFLSRDRRGAALDADAQAFGERLQKENVSASDAEDWSDPLLIRNHLPLWSQERLQRELGASFAEQAMEAPIGEWFGPVESAYGKHWVFVEDRRASSNPPLNEVLREVRSEWLRERETEATRLYLEGLRRRADVRIDSSPLPENQSSLRKN